jgi:hypothetical protein
MPESLLEAIETERGTLSKAESMLQCLTIEETRFFADQLVRSQVLA